VCAVEAQAALIATGEGGPMTQSQVAKISSAVAKVLTQAISSGIRLRVMGMEFPDIRRKGRRILLALG
jgi:hypothetical protein